MAEKKNYLLIFFKWIVILSSLLYITYRIDDSGDVLLNYNTSNLSAVSLFLIFLAVLLVFVNWIIEAIKWRSLLSPYLSISLISSFKGVLVGLSTAIFTPNRVGEYFGRSLILEKEKFSIGMVATITGSIAQILITLIAGSIAFGMLFLYFPYMPFTQDHSLPIILGFAVILIVLLVFLYTNIHVFSRFVFALPFFKKFKKYQPVVVAYSSKMLIKTLLFSGLRYVVFVVQYLILLEVFMVDILWYHALIAISAGYFVMLIIPVFTFAEAGLRGAVALFFMEMVSKSTLGILSSAISLWIINLAIPAIVGTIILSRGKH